MLVAFAGLPGSGKSSTARAFAQAHNAPVFCEPEESSWPSFMIDGRTRSCFTSLSWFRSVRTGLLHDAKIASSDGKLSVVDSYYDVLIKHYIGQKPFEWLIRHDDPYFEIAKSMVELDYQKLPRADIIAFLEIDEDTWLRFLATRNRRYDKVVQLESFFSMQPLILKACIETAKDHGARFVHVTQSWSSGADTATLVSRKTNL